MLPHQVSERLVSLGLALVVVGMFSHVLVPKKTTGMSVGLIVVAVGVAVMLGGGVYGTLVKVPCEVVLYSMRGCPHCTTAKATLAERGIAYTEKEYVRGEGEPPMMPDGTQANLFPTIWVNGEHMGSGESIARWAGSCTATK